MRDERPSPGVSRSGADGVPATLKWDCKIATRRGEARFAVRKGHRRGRSGVRTRNPGLRALIVRRGGRTAGISDEKLAQLGTSLFAGPVLHWAALVRFAG